jgi:hypothetical protein
MSANGGDGAETMELQAKQVMQNAIQYRGSAPCPTCGVIMNPVEFMTNQGHCLSCLTQKKASRIKGKMV